MSAKKNQVRFLHLCISHRMFDAILRSLCAVMFVALTAVSATAQTVWELAPYKIQLIVAVQTAPGLGSTFQHDLQTGLLSRCEADIGASWDVSLRQPSSQLRNHMTADLSSLTVDLISDNSVDFDKIMFLTVDGGTDGYRVSAREFDVRTQTFGPVVELAVAQACKLCDAAFDAIWQAFVPLARIIESKGKDATLRLRAARLPVRDKALTGVSKGDIFRPFVRYIDRYGKPRRVIEVPWTFLIVEKKVARGLKCKLHSAVQGSLSGRRRGRVEQLALAVRPQNRPTRLTLKDRVEPHSPLCGYEVLTRLPEAERTTFLGYTGPDGVIQISAVAENPLRIIIIKRGGVLLARLPMVPGLLPSLEAEVPNVDEYLEIKGFVTAVQEELVDLMSRREVLLAKARDYIDAAQWGRASAALDELRSLQTRVELLRMLDRRQEKILVKDKWTKRKIDALFAETRKLLYHFLDPAAVEKVASELVQAREESHNDAKKTP